jgi:hypothetical protein
MMGIPCKCGRFLAKPRAEPGTGGEGYSFHVFVADVRGDCKRCGPGVQAMRDGWWWAWDAWTWPPELECF